MESAHSQERRGPRGSVAVTLSLAVVVFCAPLLTHRSLPLGSDVYSTTHYLQGFMKAFSEGDLYPRWTDRSNQDLGAPSFVMFPPLTYYAAGAACWLTGSIINGFKLYLFVLAVATVSAFYVLAKQWIGPGLPAALAAAVYLLAPYHVLDLYQRFAISESTAFVFTPLVLLFARRTIDAGRLADFVGLSLAYAGLIYTHLVSALMVSLFLGLWLLWELRHRHGSIPRVAASLLCGLGLAAPFLLPAVI
ncbi:MAG: 6-pyruvoyl-tetrahydropterin synthase-related protein, partial [Acidobacteriota bacterium]